MNSEEPPIWPAGEGEMAARICAFDWSITPLGPSSGWPQSLRTVVDLMLDASFPTYVWWGPELIQFYNDPAIDVNGSKHPGLLGTPARTAWPDLWGVVGGIAERVFATGRPERSEDLPMVPDRGGPAETAWFTFSYNALRNEDGAVAGIFITGLETTNRMRAEAALREGEERQAFLLKFSDALRPLADPMTVQTTAAELLGGHLGADNSNYYEIDTDGWAIRSLGYVDGSAALPDRFPLTDLGQQWADSFAARETVVIHDVATDERFSDAEREAWQANRLCATIGVPLVKEGRLRAAFGVNTAEPRHWTDSEITLVEEVVERTWAAVERARAEAAMRESEATLHNLFNTMRQGYHECEMIRDAEGRAIDYRLTAMNPAFEQLVGVPVADAVGRTAREIVHGLDDWWVELFDEVVKTGKQRIHEYEVPQLGRWYRIDAYPKGTDRAAALFDDITEHKLAEAALRESEERQAFLLKLSDALRLLADPEEIQATATRLLGARLHVTRVFYFTVEPDGDSFLLRRDYVDGVPSVVGWFTISQFDPHLAESWRSGRTVHSTDVHAPDANSGQRYSPEQLAAFDATQARAWLGVPLVKAGHLVAVMGISHAAPRAWTKSEIALAEEVVERTWAAVERARAEAALAASEEKYRSLFQTMGQGYALAQILRDASGLAIDLRMIELNPAYERLMGIAAEEARGRCVYELFPNVDRWWLRTYDRIARSGQIERIEHSDGDGANWFEAWVYPRTKDFIEVLFEDITDRKRAEEALRESEERQRLMVELVPALLWSASRDGQHVSLNERWLTYTGQSEAATQNYGWLDVVHPNDLPETQAAFEHAFATGKPLERQHRVHKGDEGYRWHLVRQVPVRDAQGTIIRWFGAAVDIHESKLAEQALQESEERQAFLLKLSDALTPLDDAFEIERVATRLLGEALNANRAFYAAIEADGDTAVIRADDVRGVGSAAGRYSIRTFGPSLVIEWLAGRTTVANDVNADPLYTDAERAAYAAVSARSTITVPLVKRGALVAIMAINHATPREWTDAEVDLVSETANRIWDATLRAVAELKLRDSEARFRQFSDASTDILWIRDAETLEMMFASPAFDKIYGIPGPDRGGDARLRSWVRLIEPENRKSVLDNFRRVRAGERVEHEFRIRHAVNGALRWIHNTDFPLRNAAGDVRWIAGLGADITDAKEAADRQGVLVAELQHRTRNLIAVVRSLSDRTLGNAGSLEDFGTRFRLRLSALSRVQGLLSNLAAGGRVTFKELLCAELAAHGATDGEAHKFTLDGPADVPLRSASVQTFALALHELATNAAKYGALKSPDGHLFVNWRVEPALDGASPRLHVEWRETEVVMPDVNAPAKGGGYGRELIERALPYQLRAKTTYEMGPDGVRCTISLPIAGGGKENGGVSTRE